MTDDNGNKNESNLIWQTHEELQFIAEMGNGKFTNRKIDRRKMLLGYLEGMKLRIRWHDGDTRLDQFEIKEAVKKALALIRNARIAL